MPLVSIPAPIQGWNTIDSISEIPSTMALVLDNIIPSTASCTSRKGFAAFASGMSGNVDSLFELKAVNVNKFISAASGNLYDITTGTPSSIGSGFASNQWQGAVMNATLGLVNGTDAPQVYDGTTLGAMTVSGPTSINALNSITVFKNRSYFTESNSQDYWYSALSTLGHALTKFPLGAVGNFGGNLIAIQTLTNDGGNGQEDNICFFMSTGEIIIYQGTDPGVDFVLVGVFFAGRPLNSRSVIKFGPDIMFVTNDGFQTVSSLLPLSFGKDNSGINKYIKGAASTAAAANPTGFGWQAVLSPIDNILLVNIPQSNNVFVQYVLNVNTTAWCRFTGMNARCWVVYGNTLYCGGTDGKVYQYGPDYLDSGTTQYPLIYQSGYMTFNEANLNNPYQSSFKASGGSVKTTAIRPRVRFDSALTLTLSHSVDYKPFTTPYSIMYPALGAAWGDPWGTAWAQANSFINFLSFNTLGYSTSINIEFQCSGAVDFFETNFLIQPSFGRI